MPRSVARIYSLAPLDGKLGPDGEPLCTDVCTVDLDEAQVRALATHASPFRSGLGRALASEREAPKGLCTLLHTSGTHGVEGYTGSAIQAALLERLNVLLRGAGLDGEGASEAMVPRVVPIAEEGEVGA